jgi:polar amino acid transport system substrate-binding protein
MPLRGLVTVAAAVLGLAACSSTGSTTSSTTGGSASASSASSASSSDGDVTYTVPQQEGTALPYVATSSNGQLEGILPAMALAEGTALGGTTKNVTTSFESSLLGLTRKIYAWVPGADVTAVRLKSFDFATTLRDSYAFVAPAGGVTIGNSMMDVCGHSVGVVAASSPVAVLQTQSTTCTTAGKKPINVQTFADYATAGLAAKSHRVDVAVLSTSTAGYQIKTDPGVWKETGPKFDYVIIGDATPKGNGMAQKLAVAINKMIADGTYAKILAQWGASGLAITKSVVNPAPEG